jgi:hypothetical protein
MKGLQRIILNTFLILVSGIFFPLASQSKKFKPKSFKPRGGPQIPTSQIWYLPWDSHKPEDSFITNDLTTIKIGTIQFPSSSIYQLKNSNIYISADDGNNNLVNLININPTIKNILKISQNNNTIEFLPQTSPDLFPSGQLQVDNTGGQPQIKFINPGKLTGYGQTSILDILGPKGLIKLIKNDFNATESNGYFFINNQPITITLNLTLDAQNAKIDSVVIDYFIKGTLGTVTIKKPASKIYTNDILIKNKILLEIPTTSSNQ